MIGVFSLMRHSVEGLVYVQIVHRVPEGSVPSSELSPSPRNLLCPPTGLFAEL
jgi:hypothetical protein